MPNDKKCCPKSEKHPPQQSLVQVVTKTLRIVWQCVCVEDQCGAWRMQWKGTTFPLRSTWSSYKVAGERNRKKSATTTAAELIIPPQRVFSSFDFLVLCSLPDEWSRHQNIFFLLTEILRSLFCSVVIFEAGFLFKCIKKECYITFFCLNYKQWTFSALLSMFSTPQCLCAIGIQQTWKGILLSIKPDCQLTLLLTFQVGQWSNGPLALCQTPYMPQHDNVPKRRPYRLHFIMYRVTFHWVSSGRKHIWKGLDPQEHLHEMADRLGLLISLCKLGLFDPEDEQSGNDRI